MYYGDVSELPHRLRREIRRRDLMRPGDRVAIAVSGGLDSVALFRLLVGLRKELGLVLSVAHFNHQLRGAESEADEQFVAELARTHRLALHRDSGDVAAHAKRRQLSLEAAARELRYRFFSELLTAGVANRVATAHTLDDQAETVLLRVVRGAGTRGLAGIYPSLPVEGAGPAAIVRPLLGIRRAELEAYLAGIGQPWQEDRSNRDLRHARNRVRHGILPRLERNLNPAVREALAETAEIARAEEDYWDREVAGALASVAGELASLRIPVLERLPLALRRRVVRAAAEALGLRLEFRHVEEILEVCSGHGSAAELPSGWSASRGRGQLRFERNVREVAGDYEYSLPIPGRVRVLEVSLWVEAVLVPGDAMQGYNPEHLLDRTKLGAELRIRNWHAGDRFWPAHTKAPKKIKELLQRRELSGVERKRWPVAVSEGEIVWLRGFPAAEPLRAGSGGEAVVIREVSESSRT